VNVTLTRCRIATSPAPGVAVPWTLTIYPTGRCPHTCVGTAGDSGPVIVTVPTGVVTVPGTNTGQTRVGLNGLPPGSPVRIHALDDHMMPDMDTLSLNGLPPGEPWLTEIGGGAASASPGPAAPSFFDVFFEFVDPEPVGQYQILLEADTDGDGEFDPLDSFDVSNPVVSPPVVRLVSGATGLTLDWDDDGTGVLESAPTVDGPWNPVDGARPGYVVPSPTGTQLYRVLIPAP
jgi:hypothetical protein